MNSAAIYEKISTISLQNGAINLGQGYSVEPPDFEMIQDLNASLMNGDNQYSPTRGTLEMRRAAVEITKFYTELNYCETNETLITAGCTEALAATIMSLGKNVRGIVTLDPYFNYYKSMTEMISRDFITVPLVIKDDSYNLELEQLEKILHNSNYMLILNIPHNPSGYVPDQETLNNIADICVKTDTLVLSDEVYQHLSFSTPHRSIASCYKMRERTVVVSSSSKLLSVTGWRVGWAHGPEEIISKISNAHTNMSFCAPTPMQSSVAKTISRNIESRRFNKIKSEYKLRKTILEIALKKSGFETVTCSGTFFITASHPNSLNHLTGIDFCSALIQEAGVACLPMSVFSDQPNEQQRLRFSFCHDQKTIIEAGQRLCAWDNAFGKSMPI